MAIDGFLAAGNPMAAVLGTSIKGRRRISPDLAESDFRHVRTISPTFQRRRRADT
ncbi:hypothetical protein K443DRAFT_684204 [Laccaria amethystina LaAM-08-1]|uniref:Uncharacterized protein n=1 Tax=Laccaria amethystina LaAM-08-1 TaxID=1095629 RepID=A0A0C9X862_9AGAR|nr:hypothetical protein K443DRAFT_684204 [Laccaria amethystina LaAM-08-1]